MLTPPEIDALIAAAWGGRVGVYTYSLEIAAPTGFEMMPDMYFFLGTLLRHYGDARAAEERQRCATVNVIGTKKRDNTEYQAGWFDGVEDTLDTIKALDRVAPGASEGTPDA